MPKHACPCGARYTFPDSASGKRAKCKKCGEVFTLPQAEEDGGIFAIAGEDSPFAQEATAAAAKAEAYARAATLAQARGVGQTVLETSDADTAPRPVHTRGYLGNVIDSFFFITSLGNLFTFIALWVIVTFASQTLSRVGFLTMRAGFLFFFALFIKLWYSAYRYQVVEHAAGGDRNLPEIEISREEILDYLSDAFKWMLSWLFVLAPALSYLIFLISRGTIGWMEGATMLTSGWWGLREWLEDYPVLALLMVGGSLLWPIAVLCMVLGGLEAMVRVDLILKTVFRSLDGYLLTVVFWAATIALTLLGQWGISQLATAGASFSTILLASVIATGLSLYAELVSLRVIGLYYHHFKDRFAWDWG